MYTHYPSGLGVSHLDAEVFKDFHDSTAFFFFFFKETGLMYI